MSDWRDYFDNQMQSISEMKDGWDGPNSKAPSGHAIEAVRQYRDALFALSPAVCPVWDGTISVEAGNILVEFDSESGATFYVLPQLSRHEDLPVEDVVGGMLGALVELRDRAMNTETKRSKR